jgi:hypothetical protein
MPLSYAQLRYLLPETTSQILSSTLRMVSEGVFKLSMK